MAHDTFGSDADHKALRERVVPKRRHGADHLPGIIAAYVFLGLIAVVAVAAFGKMMFTNTRTVNHTKYAPAQIGTTAQLQAALGTPTSAGVDGAQINDQLAGTKCDVYQRTKAQDLIFLCHG